MNSMAQQAVPNGSGQSELPRAQFDHRVELRGEVGRAGEVFDLALATRRGG